MYKNIGPVISKCLPFGVPRKIPLNLKCNTRNVFLPFLTLKTCPWLEKVTAINSYPFPIQTFDHYFLAPRMMHIHKTGT